MREVPARLGGADKDVADHATIIRILPGRAPTPLQQRRAQDVLCTGCYAIMTCAQTERFKCSNGNDCKAGPIGPIKNVRGKSVFQDQSARSGIRMPCNGLVSWRSRTFGRFFFYFFLHQKFFWVCFFRKNRISLVHIFGGQFWYY